jgi:ribosome recycling factor
MEDEIQFLFDALKEQMNKAITHLEHEYKSIRAGKANPAMLSTVMVEYYGSMTPLQQVANVGILDAHTLTIQPWERNLINTIEKAIHQANLGFNPSNNGEQIMINVPVLTEDRRRDLVKQAKAEAENAKVSLRNDRREALHDLKKLDLPEDIEKDKEEEIQKIIDKYTKLIEEHLAVKEKEIMTV